MKKIVFLAFVLWLLSMSMFCTRLVVTVKGLTTYDVYPGESIQEAINLAESGDIIFVHAGTYLERVVLNKTVSLIGEDKQNTIIYWNDTGNVVHVTADNTVITDFTLTLASGESTYPDSGIFLDESDGNNISNNIIAGNGTTNNWNGIFLYRSSNNNISGNDITNNDRGIYLYEALSNNIISGNDITNNDRGIYLYYALSNNIISGNDITNNGNGIYIDRSSYNSIYHNDFINNAKHVADARARGSVNFWDDGYPSGGNFWDDYLTRYPDVKEIDGSGIGDTPYEIYKDNQDNYPLLPPWFPPAISIISPENKTYALADVLLSFTVSEATSWIGYSLDGQANKTITGDTTLTGLPDGSHSIVVYATDMAGNTGHSDTIYFTVDTVDPNIELLSPENKTYTTNSVSLSFTVSEATSWIGYSLDGQANKTITGDTTLTGLPDGSHSIVVYATDMAGNTGHSDTIYFTVDTVSVGVDLLSPENKTYTTNSVSLSFTVSEATSWIGYSLDGQANKTITGDTTLTGLPDGSHSIVVYATDMAGNTGHSDTIYFTVDTVDPNIELLSPENKTYTTNSVSLSFEVDEETSWIGYSLDGQANKTISGGITLTGLSEGTHSVVVYASDMIGNMGQSDTVYFTVDTVAPNIEIISPEDRAYGLADVPLSFTVSEATSWIGYSLDGQANKTISGGITLTGLSEGTHSVVVYASDMIGNMGQSDTVYFTVDTTLPGITILSPENRTYDTTAVLLSFTVDKAVLWMGYSLDGQANVTITGDITLESLVDGVHYVVVYANNTAGKMGASNTIYFTVDTEAPVIIILSPRNETYASASFSLNFTQSEPTSWIGYSLDGQMNVTVGGNTTLVGLSEGIHSIIVYATDIAGNTGSSDVVYFTVDTVYVSIDLLSPENTTYTTDSVFLSFVVDEETSWMGYSLDGQANKTIIGDTTLTGLPDGSHSIVVYATDMVGNTGQSDTIYFTIDTVNPNIEITSPENKTYAVEDVPLIFTISEATSWMGYSLDGQANKTIIGDTTLTGLTDGTHRITVYANDTAGNMVSSDTVYFTVDTTLPSITILSPENKTYAENDVPLSFRLDEPVSWLAYSLDGQPNVTITGDVTLPGLSDGSHSLIVYVGDAAGNSGISGIIHFTVEAQQAEPSQLWIVAVIAATAVVGFALTGYMVYDLFKRAPK